MINSESFNKIIDDSMLLFLDDFEAEAGRLPNEIEKNIWMRGFIDACEFITLAVKERYGWE
jgi:hypothetical protein